VADVRKGEGGKNGLLARKSRPDVPDYYLNSDFISNFLVINTENVK